VGARTVDHPRVKTGIEIVCVIVGFWAVDVSRTCDVVVPHSVVTIMGLRGFE